MGLQKGILVHEKTIGLSLVSIFIPKTAGIKYHTTDNNQQTNKSHIQSSNDRDPEPLVRSQHLTYLGREAFHEDGHEQVEEDVVAEGHQGHEVQRGPVARLLHAVEEHHVPVLLGQDLCVWWQRWARRREGGEG